MMRDEIIYGKWFIEKAYGERGEDLERVPEGNSKSVDLYLPARKMAIEVKTVLDFAETAESVAWSQSVNRLQDTIENLPSFPKLDGWYSLSSRHFAIPRSGSALKETGEAILQALLEKQSEFTIKNIHFKAHKVLETKKWVSFSAHGGGWVGAEGMVAKNSIRHIQKANEQIKSFSANNAVETSIVLLVNKYWHGDARSYVGALALHFDDLLACTSIDELWVIDHLREEMADPSVLYRRGYLESVANGEGTDPDWFAKWFPALFRQSDQLKKQLVQSFWAILGKHGEQDPSQIFLDPGTRSELVEIGQWLADQKDYDQCIRLIDVFLTDPDPRGDKEQELNRRVLEHEDTQVITTVVGRVAWVVQKLALSNQHFEKAMRYTAVLLTHPNYYIRLQACFPLVELAARGRFDYVTNEERGAFRELLLKTVTENGDIPVIAEKLTDAACYFRNVTESQALQMVEKLWGVKESGALLVIYALEWQVPFEGKSTGVLKKKLVELFSSQDPNLNKMKGNALWTLARSIKDNLEKEPFEKIFTAAKPYIEIVVNQPFSPESHGHLDWLLKSIFKKKPEIAGEWFLKLLRSFRVQAAEKKPEGIVVFLAEEILDDAAKVSSELYSSIIDELVQFWIQGGYIGDPGKLLKSYKSLASEEDRAAAKTKAIAYYSEMRKLHSKLPEVNWNE